MRTLKVCGLFVVGALALAAAMLAVTLRPHAIVAPAQAQGGVTVELDMDIDNGSGPCNPVDSARSVEVGSEYKVAVCLRGAPNPPAAFEVGLFNDTSLSQCEPMDCPDTSCLDTNPDANAGTTTWGTSLGDTWDCSILGVTPPNCDRNGTVAIECMTLGEGTLPVGPDVSAPVAIVTFKATAKGTDTFSFEHALFAASDGVAYFSCPDPDTCPTSLVTITDVGAPTATVASTAEAGTTPGAGPSATAAAATAVAQGTPLAAIDEAATATSVAEATAGANATPGAKTTPGAKATPKPTAAAAEGSGSSGPNAGIIAGIVIGVVIVVGGAGWFGWRRFRAT